jgi:hypothetical protein
MAKLIYSMHTSRFESGVVILRYAVRGRRQLLDNT